MEQERDSLPVHEVPEGVVKPGAGCTLQIRGLVERLAVLGEADIATLPRAEHVETFRCEEGWFVPDLRWSGPRLADVVALARPLPEARYVRVGARDYVVPVALEDAGRALLCTHLNGRPLAVEHGGPWRLLVPGGRCYTSVKWVDCFELTAQAGPDSGQRIALSRLKPHVAR